MRRRYERWSASLARDWHNVCESLRSLDTYVSVFLAWYTLDTFYAIVLSITWRWEIDWPNILTIIRIERQYVQW